ncbi:outer membrane protein assembly factor BamD [Pinibacter soli]|uniref:Outer membrane protein assembly factor BamD n=1 Tax=Pinibacter soli TaxID=3044211 RepID=A0ABT6RBX5_9BACT|nr:outer membrane protein assembly factor BamD [Pinibacter soli]MDI3320062.1 outer membrane protein assembly factor BamD [Pinibacter soli]
MRFLIIAFTIIITFSACSSLSKVQKSNDYEYKYRMAEQYYAKKNYNYAQQLYEELFPIFKGTPRFEDMYYKSAYSAFYLKDYQNAENLFKGFVEVYPTSPKAEEMDYMRAYTFYKQSPKTELDQTNTYKAMGLMQTFINTHPRSERSKEAMEIVDKCRQKLEEKEYLSAFLYYNMGQYKAASVAFTTLINDFPDSQKSDEYKLFSIKSFYEYAVLSIATKQEERFEKVLTECNEFSDRFPESKIIKEVEKYSTLAQNNIKAIKNEQVKKAS